MTSLLLARILELKAFGTYALATTTVMAMVGVVQSGVGLMGTKFVGEWLQSDRGRIGGLLRMSSIFTTITGIGACALLWLTAPWVADVLLNDSSVTSSLRWASISIIFHVQTLYIQGALQGFGAFRSVSIGGSLVGIIHVIASVTGALTFDLQGAVIAFTLSAIARWWMFKWALSQACREHGVDCNGQVTPADWQLIWRFALPAGLASLVTLPCMWGVTALVARQPGGVALVGLFSVAHQLRQLVLQAPIVLNTVVFSVLSRLKGQNDYQQYWQVFRLNIFFGAGFAALAAGVVAVLAKPALALYGQDFSAAHPLLLLLLLSVVPEAIGTTAYQLVQSSGRMWASLIMIIVPRDVTYLVVSALALPRWGLVGAGVAYALAYLIGCVMTLVVGLGGKAHLPMSKKNT